MSTAADAIAFGSSLLGVSSAAASLPRDASNYEYAQTQSSFNDKAEATLDIVAGRLAILSAGEGTC